MIDQGRRQDGFFQYSSRNSCFALLALIANGVVVSVVAHAAQFLSSSILFFTAYSPVVSALAADFAPVLVLSGAVVVTFVVAAVAIACSSQEAILLNNYWPRCGDSDLPVTHEANLLSRCGGEGTGPDDPRTANTFEVASIRSHQTPYPI